MIPLPKGCRLATFDEETFKWFWLKIKPFDALFSDSDMKDPETFLHFFLEPSTVTIWVEDGGFVILKKIQIGQKAEFHACFWDKHLSSRTELLCELMGWAFMEFELERLETFVAIYARAVYRFLTKRLGFREEGLLRQVWKHRGVLQDMYILSILRSEVVI
jgi:RimJ/RimL family protein N-acetyltransferase